MRLPVGTRVLHVSGRTGTITHRADRAHHSRGVLYYRVKLDGPKANEYEPDEIRAYGRDITPTAPKLHARWEAGWDRAPFINREWARKARPLH